MVDSGVLAACVGSGLTLIGGNDRHISKKIRMCLTGFFLAYFAWADVVGLVQQFFSFTVSKGAVLFFISYTGAAFLERVIAVINLATFSKLRLKKDE